MPSYAFIFWAWTVMNLCAIAMIQIYRTQASTASAVSTASAGSTGGSRSVIRTMTSTELHKRPDGTSRSHSNWGLTNCISNKNMNLASVSRSFCSAICRPGHERGPAENGRNARISSGFFGSNQRSGLKVSGSCQYLGWR